MSALDIAEAGPATLPLADIRIDPELQCRASGVSKATVREYAAAMLEGARFPAVVVFRDSKGTHWLADGFHRCGAAALNEATEIAVEIREGSRKDALLFAAGANASHGLKRSQADRRAAILKLLSEPTWAKRSNEWLAKAAAVSAPTVKKVRDSLNFQSDGPRETSDGRVMDTSKIGKTAAVPDLDRLVAKFRKLLGEVPEDARTEFGVQVIALLDERAPAAAAE